MADNKHINEAFESGKKQFKSMFGIEWTEDKQLYLSFVQTVYTIHSCYRNEINNEILDVLQESRDLLMNIGFNHKELMGELDLLRQCLQDNRLELSGDLIESMEVLEKNHNEVREDLNEAITTLGEISNKLGRNR